MSDANKPKPVEIGTLVGIADRFSKEAVIVIDLDRSNTHLGITTWGRSAAGKDWTAAALDKIERVLNVGEAAEVHADFRTPTEAAQSRARAEDAERKLAEADDMLAILITVTPVETIVSLMYESEKFRSASQGFQARRGTLPKTLASPVAAEQPVV